MTASLIDPNPPRRRARLPACSSVSNIHHRCICLLTTIYLYACQASLPASMTTRRGPVHQCIAIHYRRDQVSELGFHAATDWRKEVETDNSGKSPISPDISTELFGDKAQ